MKRSVILYPKFIEAAGVGAGVLLSWLYWWFTHTPTKLRVERRGQLWLAKSWGELAEECGMSRQAIRTAEAKLISMGLVEKVVWKFNGTPTNHYRLDLELLATRVGSNPAQNTMGRVGINQSITIGTSVPKETEYTHRLSDTFVSQEETEEGMAGKTAREVLEGIQKKAAATPIAQGRVQAKTLSTHWQRIVPKHFDVGFQKPHTMRELGMLSRYIKFTGVHALPAMEWALSNWAKFRYRAKEEMGEEVPSTPRVAALLKCCTVAVEGYLKAKEPIHSPEPVQTSAPTKEKPVLATKTEIEAMLKGLDKTDED